VSNTLITKLVDEKQSERVNRQCRRAYPLCVRVGHGLHKPVEFIAHCLRSDTGGSAFKMLNVQRTWQAGGLRSSQRERRERRRPRTMLDTPLVRGERGVFVPLVGGVRLDMALERKERGNEYYCVGGWTLSLFYLKLTLARGLSFSLAHYPPHPHSSRSSSRSRSRQGTEGTIHSYIYGINHKSLINRATFYA
jgi:hypothetical protein